MFTLIAVPFGLRPVRGGGTGLGFGLAVAIVFVYYVIATIFLTRRQRGDVARRAGRVGAERASSRVIGASLLRRASRV